MSVLQVMVMSWLNPAMLPKAPIQVTSPVRWCWNGLASEAVCVRVDKRKSRGQRRRAAAKKKWDELEAKAAALKVVEKEAKEAQKMLKRAKRNNANDEQADKAKSAKKKQRVRVN